MKVEINDVKNIGNHFLLKENTDNKTVYGVLITNSNVTKEMLQKEINTIKSNMDKDLAGSYTIEDDILPNLSFNVDFVNIEEVYV